MGKGVLVPIASRPAGAGAGDAGGGAGAAVKLTSVIRTVDRDDELVAAAIGGDERAFDTLVTKYGAYIRRACREGSAGQDIEDAFQVALLAIWKGLGTFCGEALLSTWMYTVARNAARRHALRRTPEPVDISEMHHGVSPSHESSVVTAQDVRAALARLPVLYREPLLLHVRDGLSMEEIGARLFLSVDGAKARVRRARIALSKLLEVRR
jgi:RNA polymerase sigma-70 factor (ECF subfamily)